MMRQANILSKNKNPKQDKMKSIISILFLAIVFVSCSNDPQKNNATSMTSKNDTVKAFILKTGKIEKQTTLPGELLSYEKVDIHPKIPGYIKQIKVDIGSVVRKGQLLAVIDAPEINSRFGEAGSKMQAAKAKYEASRDTYNRVLEASRSDGVIAPDELQRAKNQMLADSADFIAATFSSKSSKQIGNYLMIVAPFNGIITERNVHEGAYVGTPNEKPIVVIEDNSRLRLRVSIPEALTGVQLKDNKINFSTKASPNQSFEGKLVRKSGSIDAATRTEVWEFEVRNDKEMLKPGAFAEVKLDVSRNQPSFLIPFSAVVTTLEKKFVIRAKNSAAEWIDVSQGLNMSDKTEIFGKLNEGDTIISKGNEELKPGTKIIAKLTN
ncbi:MAG: efflux RND transporter periplasmic adaptor subunit [Bacteroidetes bacterium]|nr:MAG: efflux RND transporter periplasmic adaptor subunit [Bacteroidota bacterium]